MRRFILMITAMIAVMGMGGAAANAAVVVGNPGTFEADLDFDLEPVGYPSSTLHCDVSSVSGQVLEDGTVELYEIDLDTSYPPISWYKDCEPLNDYQDVGAVGQILDSDHVVSKFLGFDHVLLFDEWILEYDYVSPWSEGKLVIGINGSGESQEWELVDKGWMKSGWQATGTFTPAEMLDISNVEDEE